MIQEPPRGPTALPSLSGGWEGRERRLGNSRKEGSFLFWESPWESVLSLLGTTWGEAEKRKGRGWNGAGTRNPAVTENSTVKPPRCPLRLGWGHVIRPAQGDMGTEVIVSTPSPDPAGHLRVTLHISQCWWLSTEDPAKTPEIQQKPPRIQQRPLRRLIFRGGHVLCRLPGLMATGHLWLLSPWKVASATEELSL